MGKKSRAKRERRLQEKRAARVMDTSAPRDLKENSSFIFQASVIAVAVFALFGKTLAYEFVWDDIGIHLLENPYLNPPNLSNLLHFWVQPYERMYIPVVYSLWGIGKNIFTSLHIEEASAYHFANICVHAYNSVMVLALLRRLVDKSWVVLIAALAFAVHPLQVESVAWISEFRGLLAAGFGFTALYVYIEKYRITRLQTYASVKAPCYIDRGGAFFLFVLAILSKPSAVVFILFAGVTAYYRFDSDLKSIARDLWYWMIPVCTVTMITSSAQESELVVPVYLRLFIWMDALSFYLYKLVLPVSLAASYARTPEYVASNWWLFTGWIIPGLLAWYIWRIRNKRPLLMVSALLFIIGFLPVSGLLVFYFQNWSTVADRYIYLSMFGASVFFSDIALKVKKSWGLSAGICLLFLWGLQGSLIQIPVWRNTVSLWTHCMNVTPSEHRAYGNRGAEYYRQGKFEKAAVDFEKAIALEPGYEDAHNNLGLLFYEKKEFHKALKHYDSAISANSGYADAYYNRGLLFFSLGEYERSVGEYSRAIRLDTDNAIYFNNRGSAYKDWGKFDKAMTDFDKAIALDSGCAEAHANLGDLFYKKGEFDKALRQYDLAIQANSELAGAYFNRGEVFFILKEYERSISEFTRVLQMNPDFAQAFQNRAIAFFLTGKYVEAASDIDQAMRLGIDVDPILLKEIKKAVPN